MVIKVTFFVDLQCRGRLNFSIQVRGACSRFRNTHSCNLNRGEPDQESSEKVLF